MIAGVDVFLLFSRLILSTIFIGWFYQLALDLAAMGRFIVEILNQPTNQSKRGRKMIEFNVQDMTCGHCASRISKAINGIDSSAKVDVRIEGRSVLIESKASPDELAQAIRDAGYTPVAP
ncbi:heavy-metal-associated domain-containing protein [Collimonas sp.]|uniref:heavy-metal-associated domain-containing protein n=1 Tax=Collimonas sp. TaxID=1963772 RepID=UPI0037BFC6AC